MKLVLIAIARHADNKTNNCWPSLRTIARSAQCSRSTASKAIDHLNCIGAFVVCYKGTAQHTISQYVLDMPRIKDWAVRVAHTDATELLQNGSESVVGCSPDGQAVRGATIISHLTDSSLESVSGMGSTTNSASPSPSRVAEKQSKENQSTTPPAALAGARQSKVKSKTRTLAELIDEGEASASETILTCPTLGCQKIPARAGELCWLCKSNAAKAAYAAHGSLVGVEPEL